VEISTCRLFRPLAAPTIILRRYLPQTPRIPPSLGITANTPFGVRSMRKLLLSLIAMFFMAGLVVAVEVSLVSYDKDKKELKVKEGDAEKTYKVDPKGKFTVTTKDGDKESDFAAFEKRVAGGKGKVDITVKDGTVTEAKWKGGKK
jgi:hypothetical protein